VKAEVLDPQGGNPKCRPLVIVTATEDIKPNQPFLAVAITGTLSNPLPDDHVVLPWGPYPKKHPKTGLTKRAAAVCSWVCKITEADIVGYQGYVPGKHLLEILSRIPPPPPPPSPPPPPPAAEGTAGS
jgi:hypothetical protein